MGVYLVIIRPYQSILSSILSLTNEILLLSMIIVCYRFVDPIISPDQSKLIGLGLVGIIVMTIVINWIGIVTYGVSIYIKKRVKKAKLKKSKETVSKMRRINTSMSKNNHTFEQLNTVRDTKVSADGSLTK